MWGLGVGGERRSRGRREGGRDLQGRDREKKRG